MSDSDDNIVHPTIKIMPFTPNMDPVARSLARRICQGFCQFPEVIIDFDGIEFMGQGFADEMFRVFHNAHPEVKLTVINAGEYVQKMLRHVGFKGNVGADPNCRNISS